MAKTENLSPNTARVNASDERVDALKEQLMSTKSEIDFERIRIMHEVYEEELGSP